MAASYDRQKADLALSVASEIILLVCDVPRPMLALVAILILPSMPVNEPTLRPPSMSSTVSADHVANCASPLLR